MNKGNTYFPNQFFCSFVTVCQPGKTLIDLMQDFDYFLKNWRNNQKCYFYATTKNMCIKELYIQFPCLSYFLPLVRKMLPSPQLKTELFGYIIINNNVGGICLLLVRLISSDIWNLNQPRIKGSFHLLTRFEVTVN